MLAAGHAHRLKKFNGEDIDTISPTLGFNIKTLEHRGLQLNFWDVGGQKVLQLAAAAAIIASDAPAFCLTCAWSAVRATSPQSLARLRMVC